MAVVYRLVPGHKINGIDLCIYGYWPFTFPKYPKQFSPTFLSKHMTPKTGQDGHPSNVRIRILRRVSSRIDSLCSGPRGYG